MGIYGSDLTIKREETVDDNLFDLTSFFERACWWESESTDGTSSSASGSQNVLSGWINFGIGKFVNIQISWMFSVSGISTMS